MSSRKRRRPPRQAPPSNYRLEGSTAPQPEPEPQDAELLLGLIAGLRDELASGQMFIAGRGGDTLIGMLLTRGEGGLAWVAEHDAVGARPWDRAINELRMLLEQYAEHADGVRVEPRPGAEQRAHDALDWVLKAAGDG